MQNDLNTVMQRFRLKLKHVREYRGRTQEEISELLSISLRNYQRIESGEATPDLTAVYQICSILDIDFHFLTTPYKPTIPYPDYVKVYETKESIPSTLHLDFEAQFQIAAHSVFKDILDGVKPPTAVMDIPEFANSNTPLFLHSPYRRMNNHKLQKIFVAKQLERTADKRELDKLSRSIIWDNVIYYNHTALVIEYVTKGLEKNYTVMTYGLYFQGKNNHFFLAKQEI